MHAAVVCSRLGAAIHFVHAPAAVMSILEAAICTLGVAVRYVEDRPGNCLYAHNITACSCDLCLVSHLMITTCSCLLS